jgi:hypothetical protein
MASGGKKLRKFLLTLILFPLAGAVAGACPDLSTCGADEQMSIERDAEGCNVVTCLKAEANQVDDYYQDIPRAPKTQTAESNEPAPVTAIEPIVGGEPEAKEPAVAADSPAPALAVPPMAAEPESQKQPVVGEITPANAAVATQGAQTSLEPQPAAPEKAPRADAPAASTNKSVPSPAAI